MFRMRRGYASRIPGMGGAHTRHGQTCLPAGLPMAPESVAASTGPGRCKRLRYFFRVYVISMDLYSSPPGGVSYIS